MVAENEEKVAEELVDSPTSVSSKDPERIGQGTATLPYSRGSRTEHSGGRVRVSPELSGGQVIWTTNPHLVPVGPFHGQPPTELLARCHGLSVLLAFIGFVLAIMGVITFAWDRLPLSIGVFSSIAMGLCLVAGTLILIVPSTKASHIYYDHKLH